MSGVSDTFLSLLLTANSFVDSLTNTKTVTYNKDTNDLRYISGIVKMLFGGYGSVVLLRVSRFISRKLRPEGKLSNLFLNPLKPIKDVLSAKWYLAGKGKELVTPK